MINSTTTRTTLLALAIAGLVAIAALAGVSAGGLNGALGPAVARADGDDSCERVISRHRGRGATAARVARRRVGGGRVRRVTEDRCDRERYEVIIRKGNYRYEVELSKRFRVLDIDRDRIGDDDDNDDDNDD